MTLSENQLAQLREQGFVNAGRLLEEDQLQVISQEYDRLVDARFQVLGNEKDGVFPYRAMLNYRSEVLAQVVLHPALVGVAEQFLGGNLRLWWDQGINKPPGAGSPIPWHQDNAYQDGAAEEYLTCWLALDDSDSENGGLQIYPGSSAAGALAHEWRGVHAVIADADLPTGEPIYLDARAGDVLFFSSLLVHQTEGNHTAERQRRAWVIQYCDAAISHATTGRAYDDRAWVLRDGVIPNRLVSERRHVLSPDGA